MSNYTLSQAAHESLQSQIRCIEDAAHILRKLPVYSTGSGGVRGLEVTPFEVAGRFVGIREVAGQVDNPQIMAMLQLDTDWPANDETPWCSAFVNYVCWLLGLQRSGSLRARSWLQVGESIAASDVRAGFDLVVLRQSDSAPGADVLNAPGHVAFYAGQSERPDRLVLLGGNQGDAVQMGEYPKSRVLGYRRLGVG